MPKIGTKKPKTILAVDVETTGLDSFHGCMPFYVTTCDQDGVQTNWEWDVDPLTREVLYVPEEVEQIRDMILRADRIEGHNIKFDVAMLATVGIDDWPWEKTSDTIIRAHLLESGQFKDLTSLILRWFSKDIQSYEDALEKAVKDARHIIQQAKLRTKKGKSDPLALWRIAEEGDPMIPSAGKEIWRGDYWLPRALAKHLKYPKDHEWYTAVSEYASIDSEGTLLLSIAMDKEVERRGLGPLLKEKLGNLPVLYEMEVRGTAIHAVPLADMRAEYERDIEESTGICTSIAASKGYELVLPKSGNNNSLKKFLFDVLKLPQIKFTPSGAPSFDKDVIEEYKKILHGEELEFVSNLSSARKRQKSCEFFDAYEAFGIPGPGEILILHPSVNPTSTATTRLSMSNPNLQQVSKQESMCEPCLGEGCEICDNTGEDLHSVRKVFGPAPGREWYSMDAKNIELRIPAYESGEPSLIELFERPDDPPFYGSQHMLNMSIVYEDLWRQEMKAVGFEKVGPHCKKKYASGPYHFTKCGGLAMQYQCGEETADRTFRMPGGYRKLKDHFTMLEALNRKYVDYAERYGYVETLVDRSLGCKRGYPLQCARGDYGRILSTVPLNYHVQGTAGWWMVRAMNRCRKQLLEWRSQDGFDGYICLTVHDELVFDFPKKPRRPNGRPGNAWRAEVLKDLMEQGGRDINIPIQVSVEYHARNWADGLSIAF